MIPRQKMLGRRFFRFAVAILVAAIFAGPLHAQVGEQSIRIIFPFAAGGSGDAAARLIANNMREALNRPVIVENRPGADGRIGVRAVKEAVPDGDTLLLTCEANDAPKIIMSGMPRSKNDFLPCM